MPDRITDEILLERAGQGDQGAFLQLYERHRTGIFRFSYRLTGAAEVAEDITHDCFLSLIRNPAAFDPKRAALRTYLYAAARNLAMKYFRSQGRETALDDMPNYTEVASKQPLRQLLDDELLTRIKAAVAALPPLQRETLVLFEYEDLSLNEIAEIVGTDVGAVKSRLHRARGRLRNALAPYLNTNPEIVTLEQA